MLVVPEFITKLAPSVQPLVFETGVPEFPYSTSGTVFLVGYKGKAYVITTRHGLAAENLPAICVFPTDTSHKLLPLGHMFSVPLEDEPEDFMDLAVIDIAPSAKSDTELGKASLIDAIKAYEPDWTSNARSIPLYVVGYPSERSEIDISTGNLRTDRIILSGSYEGPSPLPYLHLLRVSGSEEFESFSGFSGGPVFALRQIAVGIVKPVLCGMAIRGSSSSALFHFLDASVIIDALDVKSRLEST
ncbi:serine protease family protein [Rugamonas aquatica]|uniref:Serine protease n=1 Tax=Rugamonas aquatica TaxID=2743357 RepID=A0A6A7N637_9BURK|nr:serine protease [Rugamonas aquatica]MQA40352.1 hypothetical protein [Rugamonas aquatica]